MRAIHLMQILPG